MKRAIAIEQDLKQITTVRGLTEVFEGIASVKIARIRNKVIVGKAFFTELWQTYCSIRIDPKDRLTDRGETNGRSVYVAVTSSGKLSGDIATRVINEAAEALKDATDTDVILLGSHGTDRLTHFGLTPVAAFALPDSDTEFDVSDIIDTLAPYEHISVFYQAYESLRVQRVARIELIAALQDLGADIKDAQEKGEVVSAKEYIFEPDTAQIAQYLESLMLGVALSQVLMESRLAQHAARFNAMSLAKQRARQLSKDFDIQFHRAKRAEADERLKEIMKLTGEALA